MSSSALSSSSSSDSMSVRSPSESLPSLSSPSSLLSTSSRSKSSSSSMPSSSSSSASGAAAFPPFLLPLAAVSAAAAFLAPLPAPPKPKSRSSSSSRFIKWAVGAVQLVPSSSFGPSSAPLPPLATPPFLSFLSPLDGFLLNFFLPALNLGAMWSLGKNKIKYNSHFLLFRARAQAPCMFIVASPFSQRASEYRGTQACDD